MSNQFVKPMLPDKNTVEVVSLDKLAEMIAQFDSPTLKTFVRDYEVDIDPLVLVNYNRIIKRAKTYEGLYFGLVTLLLMNNHTYAQEVMSLADSKKLDDLDYRLQFLMVNLANLRYEKVNPDSTITNEYNLLFSRIGQQIVHLDLHSGYFNRNTKNLKNEWEELLTSNTRVRNGINIYESMYQSVWSLLKFRIVQVSMMPKVEV